MSDGGFGKRIFGGLRNLIGRQATVDSGTPAARAPARNFELDSSFTPASAAPAPIEEPAPYVVTQRSPESEAAAAAFVATVRHLPLFSGTATQIVRSMSDEGASGRDLARLISTDAGLVTHLLRIVNSPYFGFANRVVTVADALSVLGVNQVRRLVTASILQRPLMSYLHDSGSVRTFWRHELMCAALASHLATRRNADGDAAYMAGLMHDVGRLAMIIEFPEHTDLLLPSHGGDDLALEREVARFGFDHAQIGGALLALWGLPPQIAEASLQHADVSQPIDAIAGSVWQANRLAHEMISEPDDQDVESPWMTAIGLSVAGRRAIVDEIRLLEADQ